MKLEVKKIIEAFIQDNVFIRHIVIQNKDDIFFFPEDVPTGAEDIDRSCYEFFIEKTSDNNDSEQQLAAMTAHQCLFMIKDKNNSYICECDTSASLSQIKMEFGMLVEEVKKQGKTKQFFKSIFDW